MLVGCISTRKGMLNELWLVSVCHGDMYHGDGPPANPLAVSGIMPTFAGVYISLENPLTGQVRMIDAKVDTGAAVTIIPKSVVEGLGIPSLGN